MDKIIANYIKNRIHSQNECIDFIEKYEIENILDNFYKLVFFEYSGFNCNNTKAEIESIISTFIEDLKEKLYTVLCKFTSKENSLNVVNQFCVDFEDIAKLINQDANRILEVDPAANSLNEVIICYPGLKAISYYRLAHYFHKQQIPIFPRLISEFAHEKTGIDIHPGATIGDHFCIDHGTGIVIGETSQIGSYVTIFQGVTIGALHVSRSGKNIKRHPTISDRCVIYANATILGGKTVIGENSVIGGNVWLTKSVAKNSRVYYQTDLLIQKNDLDNLNDIDIEELFYEI